MPLNTEELTNKLDEILATVTELKITVNRLSSEQAEMRKILTGPNCDDGLVVRVDRLERLASVVKWVAITTIAPLLVTTVAAIVYIIATHPLSLKIP